MAKKLQVLIITLLLTGVFQVSRGADMIVQLSSSDGSTKFSVQNSGAAEVASVDSLGNATFNRVTQNGSGGSFILNQNTLQTGATFYVSSGTVISLNATTLKFADGTTQATAGTMNGVSAGIGLTGGGTSGNVILNLAPNSTNYIQNTSNLQSGTTFYVSSGTATNFNTTTLKFTDGTTQTTAGTINGVTAGNGLTGGGNFGNVTLTLISNSTNYIQNSASLQSGATFNVSSGTVNGQLTAGSLQMPSGASITVGTVRGTIVPSGTLILTTATCPSGYAEYTSAGGYYLVGVPSGGTVGGTVGSAMTDLANANHNHTVSATTANNFSTTLGATTAVTSVTSPTGDVARGTVAPYFQIRLCRVP